MIVEANNIQAKSTIDLINKIVNKCFIDNELTFPDIKEIYFYNEKTCKDKYITKTDKYIEKGQDLLDEAHRLANEEAEHIKQEQSILNEKIF